MTKIGFIGAGTVGTALAICLSARGYQVVAVSSRTRASADRLAKEICGCKAVGSNQAVADAADLVFITTQDGVIPQVASEVRWHKGQSVVHCSGANSTDILEPARKLGAAVGTFHPLQAFASVKQAIDVLPGSTFAIEADGSLLVTLKEMAKAYEGHPIELKPGDKVIYHASGVLVSNFMVTGVKLATDLWQTFGISPAEAVRALMPGLRGVLSNIENVGIPQCLTGPIARGDAGTIEKHLKALEKVAPAMLPTYRELSRQTIPIALAKGRINEQQAQEMEEILKEPDYKETQEKGKTK